MFHLIISIIIFYSQCNNTVSATNPTPALSHKRRTLPTILSYLANKEPFAKNWRLLQVSAGSAAPPNCPSKELSKRLRPTGSAAFALTYTPYTKVWPSHQGPGTHFKEVSSWYATNQSNTMPNTLHTLTKQHWSKYPTIIQDPSLPPVPNPSPTMATRASGQPQHQIKKSKLKRCWPLSRWNVNVSRVCKVRQGAKERGGTAETEGRRELQSCGNS
jgi:hypothetical protein